MKNRFGLRGALVAAAMLAVAPGCGDDDGKGNGTIVTDAGDTATGDAAGDAVLPDGTVEDTGGDDTTPPVDTGTDSGTPSDSVGDTGTDATPDTTEPDTIVPDTAEPDTTEPDTVVPDTTEPDTTEPDTTEPDTIEPDTTEPDTTEPDTTEPDTTEPDTTEPDTTEPDTTEPDTITPQCDTIADLKATPEGPVDLMLCDVTVTYVYGAGFFVQETANGPATQVFVGQDGWTFPQPVAGDVLDIPVTVYESFNGQQEITGIGTPVDKGAKDITGWALDLSSGTLPTEELESRLVKVNDALVTDITGNTMAISYGTATGVQIYIDNAPAELCEGAVFDVSQAVITEYKGTHQVRAFWGATDIINVDATGCLPPPSYDSSNWNFESWADTNPPEDFINFTGGFESVQETATAHGGSSSAKLTWTSTENQDFVQGWLMPVTAGADATFSVWVLDNEPLGRGRLAIKWYDAAEQFLTQDFATGYTEDSADWTQYTLTKPAPAGAAFARGMFRLYDQAGFTTSATIYVDDWNLSQP